MLILDLFRGMSENRLDNELDEYYMNNNSTKGGISMGNPMQKWENRVRNEKALADAIAALEEKIAPEVVARIVKLPLKEVLELQKKITVTA